ncbi:hypothetical protein C1645_820465 [Glomus cerebriforme]|uniref:Uncharacterized protein n=1 Tax=Glomus cerebriforme TaxID=658196 RepID=A0A397T5N4_9GLOM|nr:hypothetical protein C1645_820465 [Glomus cerebriforme]
MSNNRFNCHLHDHELYSTPSPPLESLCSASKGLTSKQVYSKRLKWSYNKSFRLSYPPRQFSVTVHLTQNGKRLLIVDHVFYECNPSLHRKILSTHSLYDVVQFSSIHRPYIPNSGMSTINGASPQAPRRRRPVRLNKSKAKLPKEEFGRRIAHVESLISSYPTTDPLLQLFTIDSLRNVYDTAIPYSLYW